MPESRYSPSSAQLVSWADAGRGRAAQPSRMKLTAIRIRRRRRAPERVACKISAPPRPSAAQYRRFQWSLTRRATTHRRVAAEWPGYHRRIRDDSQCAHPRGGRGGRPGWGGLRQPLPERLPLRRQPFDPRQPVRPRPRPPAALLLGRDDLQRAAAEPVVPAGAAGHAGRRLLDGGRLRAVGLSTGHVLLVRRAARRDVAAVPARRAAVGAGPGCRPRGAGGRRSVRRAPGWRRDGELRHPARRDPVDARRRDGAVDVCGRDRGRGGGGSGSCRWFWAS